MRQRAPLTRFAQGAIHTPLKRRYSASMDGLAHGGALSMIAPQGQGQPSNSHVFCFSTITLEYLYQMKTLYFDDDRCHYPFGEVHVLFLLIHLLELLVVQD